MSALHYTPVTIEEYHERALSSAQGAWLVTMLDGTQKWVVQDIAHREDGPAVVYANGTKVWLHHGRLHRVDGPALEHADGSVRWFFEGKLHREGGPAAHDADGMVQWRVHGKAHREDGPALVYPDGTQEWYHGGVLHRTDGPALIQADGQGLHFLHGERTDADGKQISPYTSIAWTKYFSASSKAPTLAGAFKVHDDKEIAYREDGTAHIQMRRSQMLQYRVDGKLHREGAPALIKDDGSLGWFEDDQAHRAGDLPCTLDADGGRSWRIHGVATRTGGQGPHAIDPIGNRLTSVQPQGTDPDDWYWECEGEPFEDLEFGSSGYFEPTDRS